MRAIQAPMDEDLLRVLDVKPRVREIGRSAAFRELVREYHRREEHRRIDEHGARVYRGSDDAPADDAVWEKGNDLHQASFRDQPGEGATPQPEGKRSGLCAGSARATAWRARPPRDLRGSRLHRTGAGQREPGAAIRFDTERPTAHPSRRDRHGVRPTGATGGVWTDRPTGRASAGATRMSSEPSPAR